MLVTYIATTSVLIHMKRKVDAQRLADFLKSTENCKTAPNPFACEW